jgi:hypothetical protein
MTFAIACQQEALGTNPEGFYKSDRRLFRENHDLGHPVAASLQSVKIGPGG